MGRTLLSAAVALRIGKVPEEPALGRGDKRKVGPAMLKPRAPLIAFFAIAGSPARGRHREQADIAQASTASAESCALANHRFRDSATHTHTRYSSRTDKTNPYSSGLRRSALTSQM